MVLLLIITKPKKTIIRNSTKHKAEIYTAADKANNQMRMGRGRERRGGEGHLCIEGRRGGGEGKFKVTD